MGEEREKGRGGCLFCRFGPVPKADLNSWYSDVRNYMQKKIHAITLRLRERVGATQRRVGCGLRIGDQTNQNPFHERIGLLGTVDFSGLGISRSPMRLRVTNSGLLGDSSFALG
jgi:hypothetical protein